MDRPPEPQTRWFSLARRELLVLAGAVGTALLVALGLHGLHMVWRHGRVDVTARSELVPEPARLNVNTATEYELAMLPRIGPVTAAAIVRWRTTHGPFKNLKAMEQVKGIGPKTIEAIRPDAMCAPPAAVAPSAAKQARP